MYLAAVRATPNRHRAKHTLLPKENTMRKLIISLVAAAAIAAAAVGVAQTAQAAPVRPAHAHVQAHSAAYVRYPTESRF
jgi:hypothetical protein